MDFLKMMTKAKQLQERMGTLQEEVAAIEVEGSAGAGLVTVTLTGKGVLKAISVDPSLLKPEEKEILEDLILAAHAEAKAKSENLLAERTQALMGEIGLPPGIKLPF
ncbi:YbaB/EbfC family nucleoid-associated protein [Pseudoxanthobacter sp.]|uniref:YbaB/EbfC family nucleoid-associated protein n=1 Tax=Pseudoxanthobacter sp. TaxID=1925742 RepID=UPI002FE0A584